MIYHHLYSLFNVAPHTTHLRHVRRPITIARKIYGHVIVWKFVVRVLYKWLHHTHHTQIHCCISSVAQYPPWSDTHNEGRIWYLFLYKSHLNTFHIVFDSTLLIDIGHRFYDFFFQYMVIYLRDKLIVKVHLHWSTPDIHDFILQRTNKEFGISHKVCASAYVINWNKRIPIHKLLYFTVVW